MVVMVNGVFMTLTAFAISFNAETVYASVVVIVSGNTMGSGFAIGEHCIITNDHVIVDADNVRITTYAGEKTSAIVEYADSNLDIAVLSISEVTLPPLNSADAELCEVGDDVYTIGAPNTLSYTLTKGILSAKDRKIGLQSYLQTDAAINSGNSGGPLLDDEGRVIGINTMKLSDSEGISLAIPITSVYAFLTENDISANDKGIVDESFSTKASPTVIPVSPSTETGQSSAGTVYEDDTTEQVSTLFILAICSVALNIILIIMLIFSKGKNILKRKDCLERTDFEINVWGDGD
jgi:serine protease Do